MAGLTFAGLTLAYLGLETVVPYVTTRNHVFTYSGHRASVATIAWSPDSKRIASGSGYGDAIVHVWDATNGMHDVAFKGHQAKDPEVNMIDAELQTISWSPNGTQIVTASRSINTFLGNTSFIWNPDNANDKIQQLQGGVHTATYSPNGKYIITNAEEEGSLGGVRNTIRLWDLHAQQFVEIAAGDVITGDYFNCMVWSPDNKYIAGSNGVIKVWDVFNKKIVLSCDAGLTGEMHTVAWSPDGNYLASANDDTFVQLWDAQNGTHLFTYKGHSNAVNSVAWSPDSKYLVSGSKDGTAQVWNSGSRKSVFTYTGHSQGINSVAWSPNGKHIASAGDDQTVQVWTFP